MNSGRFVAAITFVFVLALNAQEPAVADTSASAPKTEATKATAANPTSAVAGKADYVIGPDDVLSINVWREPELTRLIPVRPDGKISLPLVGDVEASGLSTVQLQSALSEKLKNFVENPEVTVIVQEVRSLKFNVIGEVLRPGSYPLTKSLTVLDGLAAAGGFRDFAKLSKIYILRQQPDGKSTRLAFHYKDVIKGKKSEENIALQSHDTIVVP
jgi:polysaccharide export outer membrane protein